jgi:hypothetical protein
MNCEVLEVLSDITISSTQKIMTLIIRDENNKVVVSQQKWWRLVDSDPWSPGKGFQVNGRMAVRMGKALQEAGSKIITIK